MEIKPQEYYLEIAEKYIIEKAKYYDEIEPKYYLDKNLAYTYIEIGSNLRHTEGNVARKNFQFSEWQIKAIVDIFGTKYRDGDFKGQRRYRRALFFMPKKNGKTQFIALLHILYFLLDKEEGKVQYNIGLSLKQSMIMHKHIKTMLNLSPDIFTVVTTDKEMQKANDETVFVKSSVQPPKFTKYNDGIEDIFEALASEADAHEGQNVSFFTVDEGHTHPNKLMYQIISNGTVGREEPLEIHLSTAGYNMQGYFYRDIYLYAKKVKQGIIQDETFYQVMFELDDEDLEDVNFWKNKELWKKANPNIGISPTWSGLDKEYRTALESEESLIAFKTKHLNIWCDKVDIWIKNSVWTANQKPINEDDLKGKLCYAGLDLAKCIDIAALVLLFPNEDESYTILTRFWIPEDRMRERVRRDKVPYFDWVKKGLITVTSGNTIDDKKIRKDINDLRAKFDIKMIAYDPWNSSALVSRLTEDEAEMIPFRQGYASMSMPTYQVEILAQQGKLNHGNNEVLNWMCSNVVLQKDPSDNIKIDKAKSTEKVDGMVSLVMALGVALKDIEEKPEENVYEKRGMRIL